MPAGNNIGSLSIKVTPDTHLFRSELAAQLAALDDDHPIKLVLDENGIKSKVEAATAGLDSTAKVKLDVDRSAFDRLRDGVQNLLAGPKKSGSGLGVLGSFVDNLAVAAAVASIAAPALALVTGALATLPAIIAGGAATFGVIALGLDGIKKAAEQLNAPLAELKTAISGVFETRLAPVFQQLAGVMPKLTAPLSAVANGISDIAASFIDTISTGPGLANLQATIGNIATTLSSMAPGVSHLTNGMLALANQVSSRFPQFGKWFEDAAAGFSAWTDRATKSGELQTAMSNLGGTLKEIADLVGDIAIQGFNFLKDPAFGETMKTFVADVRSLVNDILPGLKNFFTDLAGAVNSVVDGINKIKGAANSLPDFLKGGDQPKPEPGANPFTSKNAPWRSWFEDNTGGKGLNMGSMVGIADEQANTWLNALKEKFNMGSLLGVLEEPLKNVFGQLGIGMATAGAEAGTQAGTSLGTKLGEGFQVATATGGVTAQIQALGPQIQATLDAATAPLSQIPGQIQQAFNGVGAAVTGSMATVVGAVVNAGNQIVAAFTASLSQIPGSATIAFNQVAAAAAAGMGNVVVAVSTGASQALAAVTTMSANIISSMNSAAAGAEKAGAAIGQGMARGIAAGKGAAVAAARDLAAAVTAASQVKLGIKSPSTVFTEIGAQTAQGLQNGLEGGFVGVIERASSLAQQLTDAVNGGLAGVDQKILADGIKKQLDELELQRKMLKVEKDAIPKDDKDGRKAVQSRIDEITALKDQLALQKEQLGFSEKYGNSVGETDKNQQMLGESLNKMVDIGKNFAMANADQFMSDLGMSGQGAIPTIANEGLSFLSSTLSNLVTGALGGGTNINVNSVDEALAAKTTLDNKKALQYAGR